MFALSTYTLLALSPTVLCIAFPGPSPTVAAANLLGRSPRPTGGPPSLPSLFRRQRDEGMCGYLSGLSDAPVSCTRGTCLYDDTISWFGCCTGSARSDCELFTTCVGTASLSSCLANSACASDDFALACTESTAGVCMTMWGEVQEGTVRHYVCGTASASVQVVATPTAGGVSATGGSQSGGSSNGGSKEQSATGSNAVLPSRSSTSSSSTEDRPRINTAVTPTTRAPTSAVSTAAAVKSAQAVVGAVGGFVGVVALVV